MADGREDAFDRALDDYWDRLLADGSAAPADRSLPRDFASTVRLVHAADRAPAPNKAFVRRLREDLMERSISATPQTADAAPHQAPSLNGANPILHRPWFVRRDESRRWPAFVELAAVAAMVLALLVGTFGGGAWLRSLWSDEAAAPSGAPAVGMYRGDAARTGVMPGPGPQGEPGLRWRFEYSTQYGLDIVQSNSSPVASGDSIYLVNGPAGSVTAINASTGEVTWSANVGYMIGSNPAIANGLVYVATAGSAHGSGDAGYLIALDAETGTERWRYETSGTAVSSPAVAGKTVYVVAVDGTLRAVDDLTGRERWRFSLAPGAPPSPIAAPEGTATPGTLPGTSFLGEGDALVSPVSPVVANGLVYATSNTGLIYAVDGATGQERWHFQTDGNLVFTPAVAIGDARGTLIAIAIRRSVPNPGGDGWIYALDAATGRQLWVREVGRDAHTSPAVANGVAYVSGIGEGGRTLIALNVATGEVVWTKEVSDKGLVSSPIIADDTIYVEDANGRVFALDVADGSQRWRVETGFAVGSGFEGSSPAVVDGMLVVNVGSQYAESRALLAIGSVQTGPGTPAATPVVNGDLSGLPPCDVEPRPGGAPLLTGTPRASLVPASDDEHYGQPAQILLIQIPAGKPATDEEIGGIVRTLKQIAACSRPGYEQQLAAFYTDDYFRHAWVRMRVEHGGSGVEPVLDQRNQPYTTFDEARQLPDGRVGVLMMFSENAGWYLVFVRQGDRWLIDERLEVVPQLGGKG